MTSFFRNHALCFEQTSPLCRCKLRFTRFLNKKAHHASLQLLFIKSPIGLLMRRKNNGAKRGFLQKESDYSEICSDDVRLRDSICPICTIFRPPKKRVVKCAHHTMNRPPKVRPKNLTIGRSVFSCLNIAMN